MITFQDTHCHLNLNQFDNDLDLVVRRAVDQGVERILVPGIDLETSRRAVSLSEEYPQVFAAIGVHPNSANSWQPTTLVELRSLSGHPKVVAIGEVGLDYYRDWSTPETQRMVFSKLLELASDSQLPVVIHNRNALQDLLPMLSDWYLSATQNHPQLRDRPGVLHSYDGDIDPAFRAVEMNFFIGFSGPVTYKNADTRHQLVRQLPDHRILAETDAPYLTPHPHRGERNEPANVQLVVGRIAELKGLPLSETTRILTQNGNTLFAWRSAD